MGKRAAVLCGAAVVVAGMLTAPPAGASAPRAAETAQSPRLTWKNCGTTTYPTLQCSSLKVPLDHADPHGRQITLALSRVPHTAKKYQGPLLVNPGGPGGSGLTLAGFVASSLPKAVAAQYDVIGFDPRGVGASKPALDWSSSRGESHPSALTEPCVTVSRYTALVVLIVRSIRPRWCSASARTCGGIAGRSPASS